VSFTGSLTTVSDPQGLLPGALAPGASVAGTLSYASGASCLPVLPTTCEYLASPASLPRWDAERERERAGLRVRAGGAFGRLCTGLAKRRPSALGPREGRP